MLQRLGAMGRHFRRVRKMLVVRSRSNAETPAAVQQNEESTGVTSREREGKGEDFAVI